MRIVHVTSYQVPGYGYEELPLAKAQAKLGHDVSIITSNYLHPRGSYTVLGDRFPQRQVRPVEELHEGVRVFRLPAFEVGTRPWIRGLERRLIDLKPDVVHCHNLLVLHPIRVAILRARKNPPFRLLVDDHMHFSVMRRSLLGRLFYLAFRNIVQPLLATQVDQFCAIGEDTKSYLITACGVRAPIEVMPLGVDTELFRNSAERRRKSRSALSIPDGEAVFLYTGKVTAPKGVDVLVRAGLILLSRGKQVRLVVVGDADRSYLADLWAEIRQYGKERQFTFLPSRAQVELPDVYAAADVAVWPRQESMAIYEAMSMGLPTIVSDRCALRPTVEPAAGRTFVHDNAESLAETMQELLAPLVGGRLGAAARRVVEQQYSWEHSAIRYIGQYERIVGRPNHSIEAVTGG